jgi:hypothetical protein
LSRIANCPQCGAPIKFAWADAIQVACPYCQSVLVRNDVSLTRLGNISHVKPDASPIQILTEGTYNNRSFQVVGRLQYGYQRGTWNEWHLVFNDGQSGWLSDAQLEYAVSFLRTGVALPDRAVRPFTLSLGHESLEATTETVADYIGMEGELPFVYQNTEQVTFLDFRNSSSRFATVDYSEDPPLLFVGESVLFESLKLKNLREFEGWRLGE